MCDVKRRADQSCTCSLDVHALQARATTRRAHTVDLEHTPRTHGTHTRTHTHVHMRGPPYGPARAHAGGSNRSRPNHQRSCGIPDVAARDYRSSGGVPCRGHRSPTPMGPGTVGSLHGWARQRRSCLRSRPIAVVCAPLHGSGLRQGRLTKLACRTMTGPPRPAVRRARRPGDPFRGLTAPARSSRFAHIGVVAAYTPSHARARIGWR